MITNKTVNKLIMAAVIIALLFTIIFTYAPNILKIQSSTNNETMAYEQMLFTDSRVMTIDIMMDKAEFDQMLENAMDELYYRCDVNVNGKIFYNVGIRPKGNSSLFMIAMDKTTNRFSFKLEFDHFQDGQTCYGLDKLALNNVMGDSTYMKEYLSYDMMRSMGVAAPLSAFADIQVNGEDWGFYFAVEGVEDAFAERNYGKDHGKLYKPESSMMDKLVGAFTEESDVMEQMMAMGQKNMNFGEEGIDFDNIGNMMKDGDGNSLFGNNTNLYYVDDNINSYFEIFDNEVFDGTNADYRRVIQAIKQINSGEDIENYIDVEQTLKYFAVNNAVVSMDSYVGATMHNYYLYEKDGKLTMLPWDYNYSFGAFGCATGEDMVNYPIDTPVQGGELGERPMLGKLLEHEEYRDLYHEYLKELLTVYFGNGKYETTIRQMDKLIQPYVKKDATAFFTFDEYQAGVESLIEIGKLRAVSIEGQLKGIVPSTKDGQKTEPELLVAADSVDYYALGNSTDLAKNFEGIGGMEGAGGMGGTGGMEGAGGVEGAEGMADMEVMATPNLDQLGEENKPEEERAAGQFSEDGHLVNGDNGQEGEMEPEIEMEAMMMSLMNGSSSNSGYHTLVISVLSLILGIFFVRLYNRA